MEQRTADNSEHEAPLRGEALLRDLARAAHEPDLSIQEHMRRLEILERESQAFELSQQAGK